ncbi:MAG TPA: CaiB/BaiF CoA-transferase family protein [Jiangellaceae bacterium]
MTGSPLAGLRVVELGGIGPGPHTAMLFADLGADVVRFVRRGGEPYDILPGRRQVEVDLKDSAGTSTAWELIESADVLIEGFRPGVAERLGFGPDECLDRNPKLVYARMTGWGQDGPLAQQAGHDINYIGLTGVLHAIGTAGGRPTPPLNLVGDFGGGSMYLAVGVLSALWERERSGRGQVVDAAIVDGTSSLAQQFWILRGLGLWTDERAANLLDTGAPFYDTYECADGRYVAVGALEPRFYAALLAGLGLAGESLPAQHDKGAWPVLRKRFADVFATRTRDEWAEVFAGTDACVTPVLSFAEAAEHPHLRARGTIVTVDGVPRAAPAPRFSHAGDRSPRG